MIEIKLHRNNKGITDDVFLSNGFKLNQSEDIRQHNKIKAIGIISSPANSLRTWEKDGRQYLFNGWEEDYYGLMRNPKYIKALDITEYL